MARVRRALDNVAIVNASRAAFGDQDRCLLENCEFFRTRHAATRLTVQTGSNAPQGSLLNLGAHESQRLVFNIPGSAPSLHAVLEPDALGADNEVELLPPVRKRVRVQVALTNELAASLINRTLEATGTARGDIFDCPATHHSRTGHLGQQQRMEFSACPATARRMPIPARLWWTIPIRWRPAWHWKA